MDVPIPYKSYVPRSSNGLTLLGAKLFQSSAESFVYSVLGAQARTRWSIAGGIKGSAKQQQTRDVFRKIVEDTIVQDDVTITISNMRESIKDTNVTLNLAITPGIILIPSDMIILKNPIAGFNNILTEANGNMVFGVNKTLNTVPEGSAVAPFDPPKKVMAGSGDQPPAKPAAEPPSGRVGGLSPKTAPSSREAAPAKTPAEKPAVAEELAEPAIEESTPSSRGTTPLISTFAIVGLGTYAVIRYKYGKR